MSLCPSEGQRSLAVTTLSVDVGVYGVLIAVALLCFGSGALWNFYINRLHYKRVWDFLGHFLGKTLYRVVFNVYFVVFVLVHISFFAIYVALLVLNVGCGEHDGEERFGKSLNTTLLVYTVFDQIQSTLFSFFFFLTLYELFVWFPVLGRDRI